MKTSSHIKKNTMLNRLIITIQILAVLQNIYSRSCLNFYLKLL